MEKSEIREIINYHNSIYSKQIKITNDVIDVWFDLIGDYDKDQAKNVIKTIAKEKNYVPNLATIAEELSKTFIVRVLDARTFTVFVDFNDSRFPFPFEKKEDARDLISFLKTMPSREDVEYYYNEFTLKRNKHVTTLRMDQSDREEFERRMKNAYYAQKVKAF